MRFGVHLSIGKGLGAALAEAERLGLECLQVFAGNPRGWKQKPLEAEAAAAFREGSARLGLDPVVVHAPYLINLASPDDDLWRRSTQGLADQLDRAALLGAAAVVVHPGSRGDRDLEWGLARVATAVDQALDQAGGGAAVWLENTAGGGGRLGGPLGQVARLLEETQGRAVGACLDTAHAWAAGYDLATPRGVGRFLDRVEAILGLGRVGLWHLNDTPAQRGSHRDRHAHLGRGSLTVAGWAALVGEPRMARAAGVLETPKDSPWADRRNLAFLRRQRRRAGEVR